MRASIGESLWLSASLSSLVVDDDFLENAPSVRGEEGFRWMVEVVWKE